MILYIKNMVCLRCKMVVADVLEKRQIDYLLVEMGRVTLKTDLTVEKQEELNLGLKHYGLELMKDKRKILVESIKVLIIHLFNTESEELNLKLSAYLSEKLDYDYTYLSNVFSELEGSTIERFYIENRIERVKELIIYEDLSITDIAHKLHYSSVSHLCLQFKKVTGETPSTFKKLLLSPNYVWRI